LVLAVITHLSLSLGASALEPPTPTPKSTEVPEAVASPPRTPAEIAKAAMPATVTIRALLADGTELSGSGFIVEPAGAIVTNLHVVADATRVQVRLQNDDVYEVTGVRARDARRDIAVLQIQAFGLPTVPLANSDEVQVGEHVVVIGTALGMLENSVTSGVISGIRQVEGSRLFQMDAAVSHGNSGGPVINEHGSAIAITVSKLVKGESLNFAIPVNYARGMISGQVTTGLGTLRTNAGDTETLFASSHSGSVLVVQGGIVDDFPDLLVDLENRLVARGVDIAVDSSASKQLRQRDLSMAEALDLSRRLGARTLLYVDARDGVGASKDPILVHCMMSDGSPGWELSSAALPSATHKTLPAVMSAIMTKVGDDCLQQRARPKQPSAETTKH